MVEFDPESNLAAASAAMRAMQQSVAGEQARLAARVSMPELPKITNPNLASEFYDRLVKWISDFDHSLDADHEVGVRLVSFGQSFTFHLEDMGYWNPSLISFRGHTEQGEPVDLIQHVSQISILLMKMRRPDPSQPKRPFGFTASEQDD